eukprot:7076046-Pyramimonas_sp.AAC.1
MRPPPPSTALSPCVLPTQYSVSWPHGGGPPKVQVAPPANVRHHPAQPSLPASHPAGAGAPGGGAGGINCCVGATGSLI